MKLKTLLLGSAAAMVAFTGAQAADAVIVAEPEPVEYVRVCDLYGSGFFYIPGTETCLKLSGSMRVQYEWNTDGTIDGASTAVAGGVQFTTQNIGVVAPVGSAFVGTTGTQNIFATPTAPTAAAVGSSKSTGAISYRARVNFDARNETDFGTLRSFVRLEGNGGDETTGAAGNVYVHTAVTSLGGLSFGFGDTFFTTNTAYGHPGNMLDGQYDYDQSVFMQYTFAAGGFSATAGIQGGAEADDRYIDPYAGAVYSADLFSVHASVIYDSDVEEIAYAGALVVKPIDGLSIKGWYQGDDGENTQYIGAGGDYQWGVGAAYAVLDNFSIGAGYSEADGSAVNAGNDLEEYVVGFAWQPVSGLNVQADYRHQDFGINDARNIVGVRDDNDTYRIRITRSW